MELELTDFRVAKFYDTEQNDLEFFVSLEKLPAGPDRKRLQLESLPALSLPPTLQAQQVMVDALQKRCADLASLNAEQDRVTSALRAQVADRDRILLCISQHLLGRWLIQRATDQKRPKPIR